MATTYLNESGGASGGSPASLDYVNTQTVSSTNPAGSSMAGPLTLANQAADPAAPSGGAVVYAKSGTVYVENSQGLVQTVVGSQAAITAAVTVANTTTETALLSLTIPASDAVAGALYRLRGWGVYSDTGTPTLTFTSRYGGTAGTQIAQVPAITLGAGVTSVPFEVEALMSFYDLTHAVGLIKLALGTSASTDAASDYVATPTASVAVTSATAKAFVLDVTWSAASASNTLSLLGGFTERVA